MPPIMQTLETDLSSTVNLARYAEMAAAVKRTLAAQIRSSMSSGNVSQAELARRMRTSRAVVHRLLDDDDLSITLSTISRAAAALGRVVSVDLKG
jgi:antitoxin HicB